MKTLIATLFTAGALVWSHPALGGEIHTAAQRGDVEKVRSLLATNVDLVFSLDERGWTPLYFAASQGHKEVVELLLANKADINAFNQNFTPLRAAVLNRHPDVSDLLIASNAQVNIFDAAGGGYIEIVKAQLETNSALPFVTEASTGNTALHSAARNGHKDVVELLLDHNADVNAKTRGGETPLQVALTFSESGRAIASQRGITGTDYEGIAELLLAKGSVVTNRSSSGLTALHRAASAGYPKLISVLLDRGADINAKDSSGRTPLDLAAQQNHMDVVELLVSRGAEMDAKNREGLTALKDANQRIQSALPSSGYEYEVEGFVNQTITQYNNTNRYASASFTVYVRDCSWMIITVETNENGGTTYREIGSTNGTEIYELTHGLSGFGPTMGRIESSNIPVGEQDSVVFGHLWLMFASRCYWPAQKSDQLTPIYDWRASVGAASSSMGIRGKVSADWELLNGPGSLPREVRYLDALGHTNAIYTITGTNSVEGMLFPAGFAFKHFQGDRLLKRVDMQVTAIRPFCSRVNLIPIPSKGTMVVDRRFDSGVANRPPSYQNPVFGQWLSLEESKKLAGINTSNTLRNLARAGMSPTPAAKAQPTTRENTSVPVLSLSIRCTNEVVKAGDEISIEFKITNLGTNDYKYADRTYDRSGRMNEYSLTATNESGEAVPDPRANDKGFWMLGGLFQYATLKPGESFTKVVPLNRWALVKDAGRYTVVGTYPSEMYSTNYITLRSDPITVTVLPRTSEEMDAYISDLTNRLETMLTGKLNPVANQSRPPDPEMNDVVIKLMFTCSPKIVPSLLKSACDYGSGGGFWEHEAIRFYVPHSEETKQAILAAATARGLGRNWTLSSLLQEYGYTKEELKPLIERALAPDNEPGWAAGAGLAQQFPDDAYAPRLIAIATTPRSDAQTTAISALGVNRTDEGLKTLKSLLDDPHQKIWTPLAQSLMNGYYKNILKTGDFTAKEMKPLIEHLLSDQQGAGVFVGMDLIGFFGADDYMAQIIATAMNPGSNDRTSAIYVLARNRTDDGVKTLKLLLDDPDLHIRTTTGNVIRSAYTERGNSRGTPLRPEDFDEKYQQPETRK